MKRPPRGKKCRLTFEQDFALCPVNENWANRKYRANAARRAAYALKHFERRQERARLREEARIRQEEEKKLRKANPAPRPKKYPQGPRTAASEFVAAAKKGKACLDCGQSFHPDAMEFDHRDPSTKDASLRDLRRYSVKRVLNEISKCDLVCACCHRVRTARRRAGLPAILPPPEYMI